MKRLSNISWQNSRSWKREGRLQAFAVFVLLLIFSIHTELPTYAQDAGKKQDPFQKGESSSTKDSNEDRTEQKSNPDKNGRSGDDGSDKTTRISGHLTLKGKDLARATVVLPDLQIVIKTDDQGRFAIYPVPRGDYHLEFYHPRAQSKKISIRVRKNFFLKLELKEKVYRHELSMSPDQGFVLDPLSVTRESGGKSSYYPGILGLTTFYLSTLPSVSSGSAYFEIPIVRGKPTMGNAYFFNNLKLDQAYHGLGFISAVNKDDAFEIKVYRGIAPVSYRNGGFSVIDYAPITPQGNRQDYGFRIYNIFMLGASVRTLIGNDGYLAFSGRRSPYDLVDAAISSPNEDSLPDYMQDYQGVAAYEIAKGHRIEYSAYGMADNFGRFGSDNVFRNSNNVHSLRYDADINKRNKLTAKFSYNSYELQMYGDFFAFDLIDSLADRSGESKSDDEIFVEKHWSVIADLIYYHSLHKNHVLESGFSLEWKDAESKISANHSFLDYYFEDISDPLGETLFTYSKQSLQYSGYSRYLGRYDRFGWDAGMRLSYFDDSNTLGLEPSLMFFWFADPITKLYLGFASYRQSWQERWNVAIGDASSEALKPLTIWRAELGGRRFLKKNLPITLLFFTDIWEGQPLQNSTDITELSSEQDLKLFGANGSGRSFGIELISAYRYKRWDSRFSYSYTYSKLEQEEYILNRSHMLTISLLYTHSIKWTSAMVLRIWNVFPGVTSQWGTSDPDDRYWLRLDPITELALRFTHRLSKEKNGSRLYFEVGYFQNIAYLPQFPPRSEFNSTSALETALLGKARTSNDSFLDGTINLGFGVEIVF